MGNGITELSAGNQKRLFLTSIFLIFLTYVADNTLDAILEDESVSHQIFSPARLALLVLLVLYAFYLIKLMFRHDFLKKSLSLHAAAMESSIDGIALFNDSYELVYSNNAHTKLYGYDSSAELLGKTWRFFYSDDQASRFEEEVWPSLVNRGEWRGETIGTKKDGSRFPQEVSLTRIGNEGIIRIVRDNSEMKTYQMELERRADELTQYQVELERKALELSASNKELETFSYTLSHDMRSYITCVSSAGQMLQDGYLQDMDKNGKYLVHSICNASEDMEELVESIQVLASISRSDITIERVNLSELVTMIAAQLYLNEHDRQVEFVIAPALFASCDAKLVKIALDNLLGNAWKYTGMVSAARIEFGEEEVCGKRVFFVRDNGLGFEMEEADRLYEPFLRLQNARPYPGAGIGLATVQRVIQLHKGELWGIGKPDSGATFYFSLAQSADQSCDAGPA